MNVIVRIDGCNSKKNNGLENQRLGSKIKSDCINDESYVSQKKNVFVVRTIKSIQNRVMCKRFQEVHRNTECNQQQLQ